MFDKDKNNKNSQHQDQDSFDLIVMDTETIPDYELFREEIELMRENGAKMLKPIYNKIVAISFLQAKGHMTENGSFKIDVEECRSGGNLNSTEHQLLAGYNKFFDSLKPKLVTFSGRNFDIPVIKARSFKESVPMKAWHQEGTKWENYTHRYSDIYHCDVMDAMSDFGASTFTSLKDFSKAIGLPSKLIADGSLVEGMYENGEMQKIREYCELDCVNTYVVYLQYQLTVGKMNQNDYEYSLNSIKDFLKNSDKEHFNQYYCEWVKEPSNSDKLESGFSM